MKAIQTKYHGPTNTRGSRIRATDRDGHSVTIPYPHELSAEEGHRLAAKKLCEKMNWRGELATGGFPDSYVHVFVSRDWSQTGSR